MRHVILGLAGAIGALTFFPTGPLLANDPSEASPIALCRKAQAPAQKEEAKFNDIPGGQLFGFTDPSDVGELGACGFALEYTGRAGKRHGSYNAGTTKYEFSATVMEDLNLAFSPFTSWYRIHNVADLDNRRSFAFDGLSTEVQYRFLTRSEHNAVAMTAAVEPRWARTGPVAGERTQAYAIEFKLFADLPLGPNWYAAANLNYAPAWEKGRGETQFSHFSGTNFSTAVTWGPNGPDSKVFIGLESRLLTGFEGLAFGRWATWAWFVGPNMLVNIADGVALNLAWTPQVAGHARGTSGHRDLDNFERQQFRIKLAFGL